MTVVEQYFSYILVFNIISINSENDKNQQKRINIFIGCLYINRCPIGEIAATYVYNLILYCCWYLARIIILILTASAKNRKRLNKKKNQMKKPNV